MTGGPARVEGTLTSWDDDRGFGFLTPTSGRGRAFVHITAFGRGTARPRVGDIYSYEVDRHGDRGPAAVRVSSVGTRWSVPRARAPRPTRAGRVALVVGLVVVLGVAAGAWALTRGSTSPLLGVLTPWLIGGLVGVTVLTALVYALDKSAARRGRHRVPERTLLLLGLLGGWPGALVAQQLLRHKTSKRSFQLAFWATVGMNVLVVTLSLALLR
ncbi:cold shock and DUF1294 domain-containing protein [Frigoribacterium sp. VKM Ac-2836]|uniref:DUF1294 domain-containing protein n=1 Tax=Frigoribacterium sp. VKM Ac-2836 TaxID=2739014 RepID=UPI001567ADFE|nr:cold shock and DUF1294 domain-containing protein [Frigoribacterium sp. VKM Ac-2836]NRD25588.1 DUF1294 domain-containing protein [Frigoribacterium sp. VKM Ac-2836]